MNEPQRTMLSYESRGNRLVPIPPSIALAMIICGTALLLAPWIGLALARYDLLQRTPWVVLTLLTLLIGSGMIVVGYLHARR